MNTLGSSNSVNESVKPAQKEVALLSLPLPIAIAIIILETANLVAMSLRLLKISTVGQNQERAEKKKMEIIKKYPDVNNILYTENIEKPFYQFMPVEDAMLEVKNTGAKFTPAEISKLIAHNSKSERTGKLFELAKTYFDYELTPNEIKSLINTFTLEGGNIDGLKEFLRLLEVMEIKYELDPAKLRIMIDKYIARGYGGTALDKPEPIDEMAEMGGLKLRPEDYKNLATNAIKAGRPNLAANICAKKGFKFTIEELEDLIPFSKEIKKILKTIDEGDVLILKKNTTISNLAYLPYVEKLPADVAEKMSRKKDIEDYLLEGAFSAVASIAVEYDIQFSMRELVKLRDENLEEDGENVNQIIEAIGRIKNREIKKSDIVKPYNIYEVAIEIFKEDLTSYIIDDVA